AQPRGGTQYGGVPGACEGPCAPWRGAVASRRSTVAVLGLGAALPSPWAPAVLQRRAFAFGSVERAPRSQVVVPGGRGPGPPRANGYEPPPQDATPPPALRIVSGDAPHERGCESCSINAICSQESS